MALTKKSELNFRHLLDRLNAMIWVSDMEGVQCTYVCSRSTDFLGYPPRIWLKEKDLWLRLLHPQDKERVLKEYKAASEAKEDGSIEYRMISKDGSAKWMLDIFRFRKEPSSNPSAVFGILVDITADRDTMRSRRRETLLDYFSQKVEDYAFITMDKDCRISGWSFGARKMMGYSEDEVLGKTADFLFTPEDKEQGFHQREVLKAIVDGTTEDNRWHMKKDGSRFWCLGILTALRDEQGELFAFVKLARDMTVQKAREEELEKAKEAAEAANEAKSQFLAVMSHELRTPLGAMIGFADALLDPDLPKETRLQYAGTIRDSGQRLTALIDDILDLSKVEAGRLEIERHEFRLEDVIRDVFSLLSSRAQQKELVMRLETKGLVPDTIQSDPTRLRQVLINILGNAIKFTEKGEISMTVELQEGKGDEESLIIFEVSDTGVGIPEDRRNLLFQPFMQADHSIARRFGGSGLGLLLSRRLARALGGDVELVASEVNRGSTFRISVETGSLRHRTLREGLSLDGSTEPVSSLPKDKPLEGLHVLAADDAPENRLLIRHILDYAGCVRIDTVEDGEAALRLAEKGGYDVILMDMEMPRLNGYEATARLRRKGYEKPVIALTAHVMPEERLRCIAAGCDDFLVKPIDTHKLIESIVNHTARRRKPNRPQGGRYRKDSLEDGETLH